MLWLPVALLGGLLAGGGLRVLTGGGGRTDGAAGDRRENPRAGGGGGDRAGREAAGESGRGAPFSLEAFHKARGLEMHRMLARVLPGADAGLLRAVAEDLAGRDGGKSTAEEEGGGGAGEESPWDSVLWEAWMARWARLEPEAALSWARGLTARLADRRAGEKGGDKPATGGKQSRVVSALLKAWAGLDMERALAALETGKRREEWRAVLEVLGGVDPGRALLLARTQDRPEDTFQIQEHRDDEDWLLSEWAARDPQGALGYLNGMEESKRYSLLGRLAAGWARKDSVGCAAWIAGLEDERDKSGAIAGVTGAAARNPAGVAKILDSLPRNAQSFREGLHLAAAWTEKSPDEALAWVRGRFPEGVQRAGALAAVAEKVMARDPRRAVALLDEFGWRIWSEELRDHTPVALPDAEDGMLDFSEYSEPGVDPFAVQAVKGDPETVMRALMERLGREDPGLGATCFEKAPEGTRPLLLKELGPSWFRQDPEAAMRWLGGISPDKATAGDMEAMLGNLPGLSPAEMRDWVLRVPEGPLREALAKEAAAGTAASDPAAALAAIPYPDTASREAAAKGIFSQWAESAPREAAERMVTEVHPPVDSLTKALENWTLSDPAAASAWTADLPQGAARDAAVHALVVVLADPAREADLPAALAWSLELGDSVERLKTARELVGASSSLASPADLEELRRTLENSPALSDSDRGDLLKLVPATED